MLFSQGQHLVRIPVRREHARQTVGDEVSAPEFQQGIVAGEVVPEADGIFVEIGVEMVFRPGLLEDVFRNKPAQGLAQQGEHAQATAVEAGRIETFGHQMPLDEADALQHVRLQLRQRS